MRVRPIEVVDLEQIMGIIERFADHDIDLADATIVWLADVEGTTRVLATDRRDFSFLRTRNNRSFERIWVDP